MPEDDESDGKISRRVRFCLLLLFDALTMLLFGAAFSVFVYWANDGDFRWFMAAGTIGGFALWYATLGRVVMFFSEKIVALIHRLLRILVFTPILWIGRVTGRFLRFLTRQTLGRLIRAVRRRLAGRRTDAWQKRLARDIQFDGEEGNRR